MPYVYKLTHTAGYTYIGKRNSTKEPADDYYWGSGSLLHKCYKLSGFYFCDEAAPVAPPGWTKEILYVGDSRSVSKEEAALIRAQIEATPQTCLNLTHRINGYAIDEAPILLYFKDTYKDVKKAVVKDVLVAQFRNAFLKDARRKVGLDKEVLRTELYKLADDYVATL